MRCFFCEGFSGIGRPGVINRFGEFGNTFVIIIGKENDGDAVFFHGRKPSENFLGRYGIVVGDEGVIDITKKATYLQAL